ncbi:MAG TPA: response regulator [Gemmatimonadales bacterium]|nr:response regulator [Gemmatimonadales bacterium]
MTSPAGTRILVVDDTDIARMLCVRVLREAGYTVIEARNGLEALERLAGPRPDLLITDSTMPGMDGAALIAEVRRRHPRLPILRTSGSFGLSGSRSYLPSDIRTLDKPFETDQLLDAVASLLAEAEEA